MSGTRNKLTKNEELFAEFLAEKILVLESSLAELKLEQEKFLQKEKVDIKKDWDDYAIFVKFNRSLGDDSEVIGNSHPENLVKQFVKELQAAYDHPLTAIAGTFEVVSENLNRD